MPLRFRAARIAAARQRGNARMIAMLAVVATGNALFWAAMCNAAWRSIG